MFDSIGTPLEGHPAAKLVIPPSDISASNISTFVKFRSDYFKQFVDVLIDSMEITLAEEAFGEGFYVSTDGRAVNWLHVRLETYPKWYTPTDVPEVQSLLRKW